MLLIWSDECNSSAATSTGRRSVQSQTLNDLIQCDTWCCYLFYSSGKKFSDTIKNFFYSVPIVVFQYLAGDFVCILKGLAASDAQKQVEIILSFIIETICEKYILAVLVLCCVQL